MVFSVFTAVWPKLFSKMNYSHGVWLLWLVLVQPFCPLWFRKKSLWVMCLGVCVGLCLLQFLLLIFYWFPLISFEFPRISHIGVGCPTNPPTLLRNPPWLLHAHFSASIPSKNALDDVSWCVFGVVFAVLGCIFAVHPPSDFKALLGNASCWCVRFFVSFMLGSPWGIPNEIFTCQPPCGKCMDSIGGGHGVQARNFSKHVPPQIFHAQTSFQKNENLAFLWFGGGGVRIGVI